MRDGVAGFKRETVLKYNGTINEILGDALLVMLQNPILVQYSFPGGKHVRKKRLKGNIVSLSNRSAEIVFDVSVPPEISSFFHTFRLHALKEDSKETRHDT